MPTLRPVLLAFAVGLALSGLSGCGQEAESQGPPAAQSPREHLVEVAEVAFDALRLTSTYTGSLRSRRSVRIHAQEEGRITSLPYYEGDEVAEGAVVLELDGALLAAQLNKAVAMRRETEANLARMQRLRSGNLVAEDEYQRAATALEVSRAEEAMLRTRLGYTRIEAPFRALVAQRMAEPGDIVSRHSHVLTLVDPASLVIDLQVSEMLIAHLGVGDATAVRIDALGDGEHAGRVLRIHPELDARTRQGRVEVDMDPVPDGARAGQFARVRFSVRALQARVMPFAALRRDTAGEHVFRLDGEGRVDRVPVRSGRRQADRVEVLEGLEPGDRVVVRGFLGLTEGMTVRAVDNGAARG